MGWAVPFLGLGWAVGAAEGAAGSCAELRLEDKFSPLRLHVPSPPSAETGAADWTPLLSYCRFFRGVRVRRWLVEQQQDGAVGKELFY